jgi:hypothetical protein
LNTKEAAREAIGGEAPKGYGHVNAEQEAKGRRAKGDHGEQEKMDTMVLDGFMRCLENTYCGTSE